MEANQYQELAARTLVDRPDIEIPHRETMIVWEALGLAEEAGEVANPVEKGVFHQHGLDLETLKNEIDDMLWYATALCTTLGVDLSEILQANIEKLEVCHPQGYNAEDSKRRLDVNGSRVPPHQADQKSPTKS